MLWAAAAALPRRTRAAPLRGTGGPIIKGRAAEDKPKGTVLVLGAGIAGLAAAVELERRGFAGDVGEARQDGISDVTPAPTGDMDIVEARRTWAKQFVLLGGVDPTLFALGTPAQVDAYAADLLERMEPDRRGFILGSGDAVPYGTPPENVRAAADAAARFPVY